MTRHPARWAVADRLNRLMVELRKERPLRELGYPHLPFDMYAEPVRKIVCADGFAVSCQASRTAYCRPRKNVGPWDQFELGYPTDRPTDEVMEYAEKPDDPTTSVYGYVPAEAVERLIDAHGGLGASMLVLLVPGCPVRVTDAESEAVARDWLLEHGYLKEQT